MVQRVQIEQLCCLTVVLGQNYFESNVFLKRNKWTIPQMIHPVQVMSGGPLRSAEGRGLLLFSAVLCEIFAKLSVKTLGDSMIDKVI
ncbi:MAG: hypothetical protein DWQ02_27185 [Bacteroidetes bacterium]|nr:MAG: hypothetical protein DWQ02_27185 [Bacteroidota bacterium]